MPSEPFCGQVIYRDQISEIAVIVDTFPKLSRTELANTICELFSWKRPTGKLKTVECRQFLERLDARGIIRLPACKNQYITQAKPAADKTSRTDSQPMISTKLKTLSPIVLTRVRNYSQRQLWCEYVVRYHYLGCRIPFGAQLRYFIQSGIDQVSLGCLQFSSPAWRMASRDHWIGWNDEQRIKNLQKIISKSRFLIFPWVRVKNLASSVLSLAAKTVPQDWIDYYGRRPVLMETLVDGKHYPGTCYQAANWTLVGKTTGRGRMGVAVKNIYIFPLSKKFRQELTKS